MSNQENVTFTTTGGHVVVLKGFITGYEKRSIGDIYLEVRERAGSKPADAYNAAADRGLEVAVISVDGKTERIAEEVNNLSHVDTAEIIARVNEITESKKKA